MMKCNFALFQMVENFVEVTLKCGTIIAGNISYVDDEWLILENWKVPINHYEKQDTDSAIIEMAEIAMVKEYGLRELGANHYVECNERAD